jgi:predicted O-methyltransferase YrrM
MSKPVPKHWKKKYNIRDFESYKDIPGWMNDTEIGTFLGQSTTYMAELIKKSKKKISFDAIDLYWLIPHTLKNYEDSGHPKSFYDYYNNITKEWNLSIVDIVKHPMRVLDVDKYVNFITCEEQYAYRLYDDDSLKFVWIDGDHGKDIVYNDLKNFWPKIKSGGIIGGDDIVYEEVSDDVERFSKEYDVKVKYDYNSFLITKE